VSIVTASNPSITSYACFFASGSKSVRDFLRFDPLRGVGGVACGNNPDPQTGRDLTEAPKDKTLDPTKIYFFQGSKEYTPSQRWRFKRDSLVQGHSVRLNEDELNTWIEDVYPKLPIEQKKTVKPSRREGQGGCRAGEGCGPLGAIHPDRYPELPADRRDAARGGGLLRQSFRVRFVSGRCAERRTFEKPKDDAEPIRFNPSTFYVGSLPVHKLLMLKTLIFGRVLDTFEFPTDVTGAWRKLAEVKVENRELVFTATTLPAS
jgi:hypothetical protein